MSVGDLYLGFQNIMLFTYIALIVPVGLGIFIKHFKFTEILVTGLISSIGFFLITNFGARLTLAMYEKNVIGLINDLYISNTLFPQHFYSRLFSSLLLIKVLFELFDQ